MYTCCATDSGILSIQTYTKLMCTLDAVGYPMMAGQRIHAQIITASSAGVSSVTFHGSDAFKSTASPDYNTLCQRQAPISRAFTKNLLQAFFPESDLFASMSLKPS
jgi:hypothetical protein